VIVYRGESGLVLRDATAPTGGRELLATGPPQDGCNPAGAARLDGREVRELWEALGEWLQRTGH
jgi:hypothetical protein